MQFDHQKSKHVPSKKESKREGGGEKERERKRRRNESISFLKEARKQISHIILLIFQILVF